MKIGVDEEGNGRLSVWGVEKVRKGGISFEMNNLAQFKLYCA